MNFFIFIIQFRKKNVNFLINTSLLSLSREKNKIANSNSRKFATVRPFSSSYGDFPVQLLAIILAMLIYQTLITSLIF